MNRHAVIHRLIPILCLVAAPATAQGLDGDDAYGLSALLTSGDWITTATFAILAVMSIATWTVILFKVVEQSVLMGRLKVIIRALEHAKSADDCVTRLAAGDPLRKLVVNAATANARHDQALATSIDRHAWIGLHIERGMKSILDRLPSGLTIPATVGATAPFIGLFGTVWGIHRALATIGITGQASIDKVAGPVGEALVMTAIGLVVAVPAVLGYNILIRRNRVVSDTLRAFSADLLTVLLAGGGR